MLKGTGGTFMKNKKLYPPLKLIQDMEKMYPNALNLYEQKLQNRNDDELDFDIASDIGFQFFPKPHMRENAEVCALLLTIMGEWRKSKQVYSFSKELSEMICDTEEFHVDANLFKYLPYPCFYLESNGGDNIHGVFVKYLNDAANHHLIFLLLCNDGTFCYNIFDLEGATSFYETVLKYVNEFLEPEYRELLKKYIILGFQASMYLCASNCDVKENPVQQKIYRPSTSVKNKFSEIRKWDVGYRMTQELKKVTPRHPSVASALDSKEQKVRNRPRQHWRKAHWHTYWVGKGRQKKELRFIAPILVNDIDDDLPIVDHLTTN